MKALDVVILGGGCAGLSLATRLADTAVSAAVIEPRTRYGDDRTWSFWRTSRDPFEDCARSRWTRWRVGREGRPVERSSPRLRYETVSAARFYEKALTICDAAPNITLRLGVSARAEPQRRHGLWRVETDAGVVEARRLVDTRPAGPPSGYGQSFVGREIAADGAVFEPSVVDLMRFAAPRADRIDFLYVLPFARDRALVEATSFGSEPVDRAEHAAQLDAHLARILSGRRFDSLREERGFIPMRLDAGAEDQLASAACAAPAGLRGGAARPSTGYAFQRIQRMSDAIAERLCADADDIRPPGDGAATRFMDGLFLRVLQRRPAAGPALFEALFRNAGEDRLERFLSGSTATRDRLAVVSSLPPAPFLRELVAP